MSKAEQAKLNVAFFGVFFLMSITSKLEFSQIAWVDRIFGLGTGIFSCGWAIRWMYLSWKEPA